MEIKLNVDEDQIMSDLNITAMRQNVRASIEGQVSKMVSDQIALQFKDRLNSIITGPEFTQKVEELCLDLVANMAEITFRRPREIKTR